MANKQILIIGGGISGLALLHYLKIKYYFKKDIDILLLEKSDRCGGTIQTFKRTDCAFELGPNGFLDQKPRTRKLIDEVGLTDRLIEADQSAKKRYISINSALEEVPTDPKSFLKSRILGTREKLRVLGDIFIAPKSNANESVHEFASRRFGKKIADVFFDPLVTGIYGGNIKQLSIKETFPMLANVEDEHSSVILGMMKSRKAANKNSTSDKKQKKPATKLFSFKNGMGELIEALAKRYSENIVTNQNIKQIMRKNQQWDVYAQDRHFRANEVYLCAPAYVAGSILQPVDPLLGEQLHLIQYAPIVVLNLVYQQSDFLNVPEGFGYLVPSSEESEILGVVFESNIYPGRVASGKILLRVMIGGAHHPDIMKKTDDELIQMAIEEIQSHFYPKREPQEYHICRWNKGIPQYTLDYSRIKKDILDSLKELKGLHLVANYLGGVSFNDCIENAFIAADQSIIKT